MFADQCTRPWTRGCSAGGNQGYPLLARWGAVAHVAAAVDDNGNVQPGTYGAFLAWWNPLAEAHGSRQMRDARKFCKRWWQAFKETGLSLIHISEPTRPY